MAGTSLTLDPLSVIRLYSYWLQIECTFLDLKQQIGAFNYPFIKIDSFFICSAFHA
jgi:hypothetical protein